MTDHRGFKDRVRARMLVTGEKYAAARAALVIERDRMINTPAPVNRGTEQREPDIALADEPVDGSLLQQSGRLYTTETVDAIVLKANRNSARVRIVGETTSITLRGPGTYGMIPGQIASILVTKRWKFRDHEYAVGAVGGKRIDIAALRLEALPLEDRGIYDLRESSENVRPPDPYAPLWRALTKPARRAFVFHPIAWQGPGSHEDESVEPPVFDASDLVGAGDIVGATEIIMDVVATDLRCIDAHALLGKIEFTRNPERALKHYEIGVGIGELSLGPAFVDMVPWGFVYNRPFLRCLHGYGLTLWKLGRHEEALHVFERILTLNPDDNQGVRFLLDPVRNGQSWEEFDRGERAPRKERSLPHGATLH